MRRCDRNSLYINRHAAASAGVIGVSNDYISPEERSRRVSVIGDRVAPEGGDPTLLEAWPVIWKAAQAMNEEDDWSAAHRKALVRRAA